MRPPLVRETSRLTWGREPKSPRARAQPQLQSGSGARGLELGRDGLKSLISSRKQGGFLEKIVLEAPSPASSHTSTFQSCRTN